MNYFSRDCPNLATVIPAMDFTDEVLATNMVSTNYCSAIKATLALGKRMLNRYYSKSDSSETYCIAIGEYYYIFYVWAFHLMA